LSLKLFPILIIASSSSLVTFTLPQPTPHFVSPAFALGPSSRLLPVDIYHDADSNLCILGRADFTGDIIIHQNTGDGPVKERKERVVAGMVMWPIELEDGKGKGKE
jgi:hypothetical protein